MQEISGKLKGYTDRNSPILGYRRCQSQGGYVKVLCQLINEAGISTAQYVGCEPVLVEGGKGMQAAALLTENATLITRLYPHSLMGTGHNPEFAEVAIAYLWDYVAA
jgi:hypothetical protein